MQHGSTGLSPFPALTHKIVARPIESTPGFAAEFSRAPGQAFACQPMHAM
jgi:hypothetical protein